MIKVKTGEEYLRYLLREEVVILIELMRIMKQQREISYLY